MSKCKNCGCSQDGGFCSNCHEEVYIMGQYSDLGEEVPRSIMQKANEQINDPERIKMAQQERERERERLLRVAVPDEE